MSENSIIQHEEFSREELFSSIQKGNKTSILPFYEFHKIDNFILEDENTLIKKEDQFYVDLSDLTNEELIELHQFTNWYAPSLYFRQRFFGHWKELDEETLLLLCQMRSEEAKHELFQRYKSNLKDANDEILVMMIQDANEFALEVLFERYVPIVKRIIRRLEKRFFFRGYETDDLISEGIIGLYKSKDDFKIERKTRFKDFSRHVIEKHIGTLILRSSNYKNKVLNESFSYHSPIGNDSEVTFEHMLKSEGFKPEQTYVNKESFYSIWEKLTDLERNVLQLYSLGLSYEEIGEKVGKKKKAIDNTIQRIRKKGKSYESSHIDDDDAPIRADEIEVVKWLMWLYNYEEEESIKMIRQFKKANALYIESDSEKELASEVHSYFNSNDCH